jgi:CheY-specific phosphatase CheX
MKRQIDDEIKERVEKGLQVSSIRTFEDTCFMYVAPEMEEVQKNMPIEAASQVQYRGDFTGRLLIETRGGLLSAIAANMLSNDDTSAQQKKDALGEVANIICGNVVISLGRSDRGYKIESPRFLSKEEMLKEEGQGSVVAKVTLNFNEGRADIKFFVDDHSAVGVENCD